MNNNSFTLRTIIINSNNDNYIKNKTKKLNIKKKIGEGSYGIVFLLDNEHVIKIFKNSTLSNTKLNETNYLIPLKNENRELIFLLQYKSDNIDNNYLIQLYAIGIIKDKYIDNNIEINSYFIILPFCHSFYNIHNIYNKPLIENENGIRFTLNIMQRLLEISIYLEKKYKYINLDFKLNNFMFSKKSYDLNNLIMIDFSIVKKNIKNKKYDINRKYYIWPSENNVLLENLNSYSVSINGLELLFGYNKIKDFPNENKIINYLKIINSKNKKLYNIFYCGLILKININELMKLINNFK